LTCRVWGSILPRMTPLGATISISEVACVLGISYSVALGRAQSGSLPSWRLKAADGSFIGPHRFGWRATQAAVRAEFGDSRDAVAKRLEWLTGMRAGHLVPPPIANPSEPLGPPIPRSAGRRRSVPVLGEEEIVNYLRLAARANAGDSHLSMSAFARWALANDLTLQARDVRTILGCSWSEALRRAGLQSRYRWDENSGSRLKLLRDAAEANPGRTLSPALFNKWAGQQGLSIKASTIINEYGWKRAKQLAGVD